MRQGRGRDSDGGAAGRLTRRAALLSASAALTAACGDNPTIGAAKQLFNFVTGRGVENPLTREQIEKTPYAMLEVRVGRSTFAVVVLSKRVGPELYWISADRAVIVTRSGRVVKTVGLPVDIVRTAFITEDPVVTGLHRLTGAVEAQRIVDFSSSERYGRLIDSHFEVVGQDPITIVELNYPTRLIRERNVLAVDDWEFENLYWIDPGTGIVWQSVQHVSHEFPPLRIKVLKPPAANV